MNKINEWTLFTSCGQNSGKGWTLYYNRSLVTLNKLSLMLLGDKLFCYKEKAELNYSAFSINL